MKLPKCNITVWIIAASLFLAIISSQNVAGQIQLYSIPSYNDYSYEYLGEIITRENNYKDIDKKAEELGATHYYIGPSYARINQVGNTKVIDSHSPRATVVFYKQLSFAEAEKKRQAIEEQKANQQERIRLGRIVEPGKYYAINDTLYRMATNGLGEVVGQYTCNKDSVLNGYFYFKRLGQSESYLTNNIEGFFENGRLVYEVEYDGKQRWKKENIYSGDIKAYIYTDYVTNYEVNNVSGYNKGDLGNIRYIRIEFNEYFSDLSVYFHANGNVASKSYCGEYIKYKKRNNEVESVENVESRCPDIEDFDFSPFYSFSETFKEYYPPN